MDQKLIGRRIKIYRKQAGLTQEEFAKRIDKSLSSVKKYETGLTEIPYSVISTISRVLGVAASDILLPEYNESSEDDVNKYFVASADLGHEQYVSLFNYLALQDIIVKQELTEDDFIHFFFDFYDSKGNRTARYEIDSDDMAKLNGIIPEMIECVLKTMFIRSIPKPKRYDETIPYPE